MEEFIRSGLTELPCGHHYCGRCLTQIFKAATTDGFRYPPRCCRPISLDQARRLLNMKVEKDYLEKRVEWDTNDRTYCSNKNCLAFIRPAIIRGKKATCSKCGKTTCSECKTAAHYNETPCGKDNDLQKALSLIQRNRWQRCTDCGEGIERTEGCNHMM